MKIDWGTVVAVLVALLIFKLVNKPLESALSKVGMWEETE